MTRRTRKILFFVFLIIFLLVSPTLILYYQGYRFDFEKKILTKTGGLFLNVIPKQVNIYLDGKLIKKTDFFFGSVLIENLLPKKYQIEVKKEGYSSWKKELEIKEKEVTSAKNIVLFPENPIFNVLTKGVEAFWFFPDQKKVILKEIEDNIWILKLYELNTNLKSQLFGETQISKKGAELLGLKFSENGKQISLEVEIREQPKYFSLEIDKMPPLLKEANPPLPPLENIITYQKFNEENYYLDNLGYFYKADASFQNGEKISENPFPIKQETDYQLKIFSGPLFFLREGQTLYLFNQNSKTFEKFFEGINNLKISPDSKKIAYFSEAEIWVLKDKETIFLIRLSEKIKDVFWIGSDYLIFNAGDNMRVIEIDNRDKINIVDLAEFKAPEIFWNQTNKKLYLLSEKTFYTSESLIK